MAAVVTKSEFWTRNQQRIAPVVDAHRNDAPKTGFAPLPGGIKNGIAKVVFCGFGKNDNGEYFRCEAEVIAPQTLNGVPLTGMKTSRVAILQDTDLEASVVGVTDMLKLLGCEFPAGTVFDPAAIGAAITAANPPVCIRFSTRESPPAPNPKKPGEMYPARVWEDWHGVVPGYVPPSGTAAPSANGSSNGHANPAPWSEATKPTTTVTPAVAARVEPTVPAGDYTDTDDLDSMGARASDDAAVADKLEGMAKALGYTQADMDSVGSWDDVVEWIKSGKRKGESSKEDDDKPRVPVKTDSVEYAPPDKKNDPDGSKGTRLKPVACEVTEVQVRKGTVTLVRFDDRSKKYLGVPYSELVYAAE